jgi:hypothetical protein
MWPKHAVGLSAEVRERKARLFNAMLKREARTLRDEGKTLERIAAILNAAGFRTARGREWKKANVWRLLERVP